MKFIINTTNLQSGGALQVALSLLDEWRNSPEHQFHVFLSPQLASLIDQRKYGSHFTFYTFTKNPASTLLSSFTFGKKLSKREHHIKPDAVLSVFGPALWKPENPHLVGFANGYYLFDTSDYIIKKILINISERIKYFLRQHLIFRQLKKEAVHYWVETNEAKKRLASKIKTQEDNITVIGNTYGSGFKKDIVHEPNTSNTFNLLFVSAYYKHKNFQIIPQVITILKESNIQCTFVLTLPDYRFDKLFGESCNSEYLRNAGPVSPDGIAAIYQEADAVFMPSILETFSANYPEAMKMGLPIICSDYDFSRNICGDAAIYFDAGNPVDTAGKIINLIQSKELQKHLIAAGKKRLQQLETPESRASKLQQLLKEIATQKSGNN